MRYGHEILQKCIGQRLTNGIFESYYFNGQLSNKIHVTYLKFEKWLHITTTDFTAISEIETTELEQIKSWTNEDNSRVEFPLTKIEIEFPLFKNLIGRVLIDFNELYPLEYDECVGLKFYFDNGLTLIQYSDSEENSHFSFDNIIPLNLRETTKSI